MKKYTSEQDLENSLTESKNYTDSKLENKVDKINCPFKFGVDSNGNYGYYKDGADTVTPFKTVAKKIGTITCGLAEKVLDCSNLADKDKITADNFYLIPTSFTIIDAPVTGDPSGEITFGEYIIRKTYSNYIFRCRRDSIQGNVPGDLKCDVSIIY